MGEKVARSTERVEACVGLGFGGKLLLHGIWVTQPQRLARPATLNLNPTPPCGHPRPPPSHSLTCWPTDLLTTFSALSMPNLLRAAVLVRPRADQLPSATVVATCMPIRLSAAAQSCPGCRQLHACMHAPQRPVHVRLGRFFCLQVAMDLCWTKQDRAKISGSN